MADISLKRIRKMMHEKTSKITDKQLFTSDSFQEYVQKAIDTLLHEYRRPFNTVVAWDSSEDAENAYTDGNSIWINADSKMARSKERLSRFKITLGLAYHECGHNLFTDFLQFKKTEQMLVNERMLYPEPDVPEYEKVKEWFKEHEPNVFLKILFFLYNAIEDGYVEKRLVIERPGYKPELKEKKDTKYDIFPSFEQMKADEKFSTAAIVLNMVFLYAAYGRMKLSKESLEEKEMRYVQYAIPSINKALNSCNPYDRQMYVNEVFCKLFPLFIEKDKKEEKPEEKEEKESASSEPEKTDSKDEESSETKKSEGEGSGEDETFKEEKPGGGESLSEEEVKTLLESIIESVGEGKESLEKEKETYSKHHTRSVDSTESTLAEDEETSVDDSETEESVEESEALSHVEKEVARELVEEMIEKEIAKEDKEDLSKVMFSSEYHAGVKSSVDRASYIPCNKEAYEKTAPSLLIKSKCMQKELIKEIKDRQDGGKNNGLYMGRRIDASSLHRIDKRFMYKMDLPEDIPDMCVMLLLDESGSMGGERIKVARDTAIVMHDFCTSLNIPISIVGHTESYDSGKVMLKTYAAFDSVDNNDKYRLMNISAKENNRDGYALRYCAEKIINRPEETKILFVVSDGAPAARGYNRFNGTKDVQEVVSEYRKKGVQIITAGIGSDRKSVESVYCNGLSSKRSATYLDVSNMEKLPKTFVKILKGFLEKAM